MKERSLSYRQLGAGSEAPEMLVIPGWGMDPAVLLPWLSDFASRYRVRLVHLPGMGADPSGDKPEEWLADLHRLIEKVAVVIGWSLGGNLALALAGRHPESVSAVVCLATNPKPVASQEWPEGISPDFFAQFLDRTRRHFDDALAKFVTLCAAGDGEAMKVSAVLEGNGERWDKDSALTALEISGTFDQRRLIAEIKRPVCMIFGQNDVLVPAGVAARLPREVERAVVSGCGHVPFVSHPARCREVILDFLGRRLQRTRLIPESEESPS